MNHKLSYNFISFSRIFGTFPVSYNKLTDSFKLNSYLLGWSIFIYTVIEIFTMQIFYKFGKMSNWTSGQNQAIYNCIYVFGVNFAYLTFLHQTFFKINDFIKILNEVHVLYSNPFISKFINHDYVCNGIVRLIICVNIIIPTSTLIFSVVTNLTYHKRPDLLPFISAVWIQHITINSSIIPVVLLFWIMETILIALVDKIKSLYLEIIDGYENQPNKIKIDEQIGLIMIYHDQILNLLEKIIKHYSMPILINLSMLIINIIWGIYTCTCICISIIQYRRNFGFFQALVTIISIMHYISMDLIRVIHSFHNMIHTSNKFIDFLYYLPKPKMNILDHV